MKALVVKSTGSWYQIKEFETNTLYEARIRGKFKLIKNRLTNPISVGDSVEFQLENDDIAWITKIETRKNYLIRKSVNLSKEAHIIASNLDIAVFLFSFKMPETSLGFLDRFLVCCTAYSIPCLILFNKMDLYSEEEKEIIAYIDNIYQKIGYQTLQISSVSELNLDELKRILKNKICVFFGHSGCGKSTLVKTLQPNLDIKTNEISLQHEKGKHTTTFAQMHDWDFGGAVIDTPGVREFGMIDVHSEEIQSFFPDIFLLKDQCKFHNCMHIIEPKCAVIKGVANQDIEESRYATYLKLMEEADELNKY